MFEILALLKRQVLLAIAEDDFLLSRLFLKGGTAIDLQLQRGLGRSSTDLDFSVEGELPPEAEVESRFRRTIERRFDELEYIAFDIRLEEKPPNRTGAEPIWPSFWGGYRVSLKVIRRDRFNQLGGALALEATRRQAEVVASRQERTFHIEISKHEYVGEYYESVEIGDHGEVIYAYSVPLLVAEKLRAICQQMPEYPHGHRARRARDYFDIVNLLDAQEGHHELLRTLVELLPNVFAAKYVPLQLLLRLAAPEVVDHHRRDFEEHLRPTVRHGSRLAPFDDFVARVASFATALFDLLPQADPHDAPP